REWRVHLPVGYRSSRSWPLVIAFHGLFGTPAEFEKLTGLDAVADHDGFIVVYPRGIKKSWAAGVNAPADRAGVDDVAFVSAMLGQLESRYRIDPRRVVITGFSNGAHMVQLLACRMASRWRAVVPVSGTLPPTEAAGCRPDAPVSIIAFHGMADPVDPYAGGKVKLPGGSPLVSAPAMVARWARLDGCSSQMQTAIVAPLSAGIGVQKLTYPGCRNGKHVRLYRIVGGGHTWPGGPQYLPKFLVGAATHAISASAVIGMLASGAGP
ncbi:MAG TPA: PHB depolymerase family esterase, partial [Nevskiaceae bacterium]|nr:PHB depolymerase family esterase [Nevskiaceae bacterium]